MSDRTEYFAQYRTANMPKILAYQKEWREKNPEAHRAKQKKWREANRAQLAERRREYNAKNKEKVRAYARARYAKDRDRLRAKAEAQRLKDRYGITVQEKDALFAAQGERCAGCLSDKPHSRGWHVDHSHDDGRVRGILCARCNHTLGHAKDNPETLRRLADYLEKGD